MATIPPPPSKRQKLAAETAKAEAVDDARIPDNLGSVRIQFSDAATGLATGGQISIPIAQATTQNLTQLLNDLKSADDDDDDDNAQVPYTFSYTTSSGTSLDISTIYHSLIKPLHTTTESLVTLTYRPQAIFRVRPVSRCTAAISGHGSAVLAVSFPPHTSNRFATGSGDKTAKIFDAETGTVFKTLAGHRGFVLAVAYSPDGTLLATGDSVGGIRIWDGDTGAARGEMKGHAKWVTAFAWEPFHLQERGRARLASSGKDGMVHVWDVMGQRVDLSLSAHVGTASCVRWGGSGYIYTSGHDRLVRVWDSKSGGCLKSWGGAAHWVNHIALSTDYVLRTAFYDPQESVPESEEGKRELARKRWEDVARRSGSGKMEERIVGASEDTTMHIWTSSSVAQHGSGSKPLTRLTGHQKGINHVTWSPTGDIFASSGFDNAVKLWRRDGTYLKTLKGPVAAVYMSAFSADGRLLVCASKDSTLKVYDVGSGKLKEDLPGHRDEVYALDWMRDRVASGGKDKMVRIWSR